MVAFSTSHFMSGKFSFPRQKSIEHKTLENYIDFEGKFPREYYLPTENRYYKMIMQSVTDERRIYQLRKYLVRVKEPGVCPTLTANMGEGGHNVPFVMTEHGLRKLTEQECLRLQGFPEEFNFPDAVPRAKRYTQVGNAVTVPVATLIAEKILERVGVTADGGTEPRLRISA
jgi:DNA (cytosine-5)-methyltransferase 1